MRRYLVVVWLSWHRLWTGEESGKGTERGREGGRHIYMTIYIERERDRGIERHREREREIETHRDTEIFRETHERKIECVCARKRAIEGESVRVSERHHVY